MGDIFDTEWDALKTLLSQNHHNHRIFVNCIGEDSDNAQEIAGVNDNPNNMWANSENKEGQFHKLYFALNPSPNWPKLIL